MRRLGAAAIAVDVGGVEQGDADVERLVDHLAGAFDVEALAEIVAAETDCGHAQAGAAEIANFHDKTRWLME